MTTKLTATTIKTLLVQTLKDNKALATKAISVKKITGITDYMIIATANSTTHAKALSEKIIELAKAHKIKIVGIEGTENREWILVDLGFAVVHLMLAAIRKYYSLEELWNIKKPPNIQG